MTGWPPSEHIQILSHLQKDQVQWLPPGTLDILCHLWSGHQHKKMQVCVVAEHKGKIHSNFASSLYIYWSMTALPHHLHIGKPSRITLHQIILYRTTMLLIQAWIMPYRKLANFWRNMERHLVIMAFQNQCHMAMKWSMSLQSGHHTVTAFPCVQQLHQPLSMQSKGSFMI